MTGMRIHVKVRTSFEGVHRWKDAPPEVNFLKNYHRHVFHVTLIKEVTHLDRDVEFITLKRAIDHWLALAYDSGEPTDDSCETMAANLLLKFGAKVVEVSEDGENGAVVQRVDEM